MLIEEAVKENNKKGTSTISVVTLHPQTGMLHAAYLGDSVYKVYKRAGKDV